MRTLELIFENGDSSLSVRSFRVRERMSELFQIDIVARTADADVDFEALIGGTVQFSFVDGLLTSSRGGRSWKALCIRCEQVRAEPDGLSTYELTLVPRLWLLGQRRNYRLFQHVTTIDIATALLDEWKVPHRFDVSPGRYPPLELRVQYDETDFDFLKRLLEEAGISFRFDHGKQTELVLSDEPQAAEPRPPLAFVDAPEQAQAAAIEYCTDLRVRREMRPARVVLRDFDFRRPRYQLFADASTPAGLEERLEQYHYAPGSFVTEGHRGGDTPTADDLGVARADAAAGSALAKRILEGERARRRAVTFRGNAFDVSPGTTLSIAGHPRSELSATGKLLMVALEISGGVADDQPWEATGEAVFTDGAYRPALVTARPRVVGVQSAVVVGPEDETVYTDEFGRVRVQFHWDRSGKLDETSSCWMRVSQAWAGPGYGLFNLPRVGHEVLVGFVEGDADQPVIVGRVFNGAEQVPYPLPGSKMMSGWKSDSNSNIILFDDTAGDEMFYTQAERNKLNIVKRHEATIVGGRRTAYIGTTDKTLVTTSAARVACGNHTVLAGITNKSIGAISWKAQAGFGAEIKAGRKFEANVTPVVPFITALMAVNDVKAQIITKLPGGVAPDLKQMLPYSAGGPAPSKPNVMVPPPMTQAETEAKLKETLAVVGAAVTQFEPEEVEAMADASDLDHAVTTMLTTLQEKGGAKAVNAMKDAQQLTQQLKVLSAPKQQQPLAKGQQQPPKQSGMFEKLMLAIVEMILPKTRIEITHQKIKIYTAKATVELDKDNIKLEAKGDITLKADGKVKIEGSSVSITPSPCKCG